MPYIRRAALTTFITVGLTVAAAAQSNVTQADIQRLQDNVYQAGTDVTQVRTRDAARANQLQTELDELREEVIYLKVKLRKEGSLVRSEYADVRDRIEDLRTRARRDTANAYTPPPASPASPAPAPAAPAAGQTATRTATPGTAAAGRATSTPAASSAGTTEIPVGTELDVRLASRLNSGTAAVEDRFEGTTLVDFTAGGRQVVPAGSVMRGVITNVEPATRTNRTARMTLSFDQLTINGRAYPIRATVTQAIEGEGIKGEAGRIGAGAGVGAIIGGILGGFRGALAGILIGGGGTLAATEGKEVDLPAGSVLRVRIDSPVQVSTATAR